MFDRIITDALRRARISEQAFDAAIRKAGFKSRLDWLLNGAPPSLIDAYNARVQENHT